MKCGPKYQPTHQQNFEKIVKQPKSHRCCPGVLEKLWCFTQVYGQIRSSDRSHFFLHCRLHQKETRCSRRGFPVAQHRVSRSCEKCVQKQMLNNHVTIQPAAELPYCAPQLDVASPEEEQKSVVSCCSPQVRFQRPDLIHAVKHHK